MEHVARQLVPSVVQDALPLAECEPEPEEGAVEAKEEWTDHRTDALQRHLHGMYGMGGPRKRCDVCVMLLVERSVEPRPGVQRSMVDVEARVIDKEAREQLRI